ncbi:MAG: hypothetical protein FWE86_03855 [Oscillospiraceae bacterium]|nr:hypothetical protein [Oscillospiraceae bacterium]
MSGLGLLILVFFLLLTVGLVMLYWSRNEDIGLARTMMLALLLLTITELVMAVAEFPVYIVDAIIFVSMGSSDLAYIMLGIYGLIIGFVLFVIIPRVKWKRVLTATPAKLIVAGILLLGAMAYTELFNGRYSFDSPEEYASTRAMYAQYDLHFFPTKYIKMKKKSDENNLRVSVYPFDAESAAGRLDFVYRAEIMIRDDWDGQTRMYFFPFTFKTYTDTEPVDFADPYYGKPAQEPVSESDDEPDDAAVSDTVSA